MSVYQMDFIVNICWDFPGGSEVKNPLASAGDTSLIPDPGRFHWPQSNEAPAPLLWSPCSGTCAPL